VNVGGTVKPSDAIREVGRLVWALHLHDNNGDGDFHLPPGKGNIDWSAVARALRDASYRGTLNLELSEKGDVWKAVGEGLGFLRRIFD
jgi:sugar phosphate isomerase/epimerase